MFNSSMKYEYISNAEISIILKLDIASSPTDSSVLSNGNKSTEGYLG